MARSSVLVIDDDAGMRVTLSEILKDEGYSVAVANDGVEGLAALERSIPGIILLDISMPRMDGYAFADELGRRGLRSQVGMIVLTADGRAQQKATRVGADGYVAKPFSLDGLLEEIARVLAGRT